jgi:hypothetical protein
MTKVKPKGGRPPHEAPETVGDLRRLSRAQVMRFLGIPPATLDAWRRAGLPDHRGRFDAAGVVAWLREQWRRERAANTAAPSAELEGWRRARRQREELALDEARGRLVPRTDVQEFVGMAILTAKGRLFGLVTKAAAQLAHLAPRAEFEVERVLRAEVHDVCDAFARSMHPADHGLEWPPKNTGTAAPSPTPPPPAATTEPLVESPGTEPDGDENDSSTPADEAGNTTKNEETNR